MKKIINNPRMITAVIVSSSVGPFLGSFFGTLLTASINDIDSAIHSIPTLFMKSLGMLMLGPVVALPTIILFGIPVYFLLKKYNAQFSWLYMAFGAFGGSTMHISVSLFRDYSLYLKDTLIYASLGLFTALIFWFIAIFPPFQKVKIQ